jgi:porin
MDIMKTFRRREDRLRHRPVAVPACVICVLALGSSLLRAQEPSAADRESVTTTQPAVESPDEEGSLPEALPPPSSPEPPAWFRLDYSGDLWTRPTLTGDWVGARNELASKGIALSVETLQFMQGNAHGGKDTTSAFRYSGSADYILEFDTQRMGLWPGGYMKLRGETLFGQSINAKTGAISAPNFDGLLPMPDDGGLTTLTEAWFMQWLSEEFFLLGGKMDLSRLPGGNEFASDPYNQFLNTSFWQNPVTFSTIPYTALTAGVGFAPTKWFDMTTLVMDSYGTPTRTGFDTAFHSPDGVSVVQALNFHVEPFGLKGNHRLTLSWSSRDKYALEDIDRLLLSGLAAPSFSRLNLRLLNPNRLGPGRFLWRSILSRALAPEPRSDDWMISYDFDQYLYTEPEDPAQGFGVFGRFGWSPGELNLAQSFYSIGVGGMGVVPTRDRDRFGVGYYLLNFSDDLPAFLHANAEQGVELFYNVEVTPWLHITPDLQVIVDPGGGVGNRDVAIVYGLRVQMSL